MVRFPGFRRLFSQDPDPFSIPIDFPVYPRPRWTVAHPHRHLLKMISGNDAEYANLLQQFLDFRKNFRTIRRESDPHQPSEPHWMNDFIRSIDAISLYCMVSLHNPRRYIEVGSGESTKFIRRAIRDGGLETKIISVDPQPRAEIDQICDEVIRQRAEDLDPAFFRQLRAGDFLFIDASHRVFTNSDVTALFLDVFPDLEPGVIVHIHDIFLPYDYPAEWNGRYYSEQYLMGAYLLGMKEKADILLPVAYITRTPDLYDILSPVWNDPLMKGMQNDDASSFWMRMSGRDGPGLLMNPRP